MKLNVLLIDRSAEVRALIGTALREPPHSYEVLEADTLPAAARICRDHRIDIAFAANDMGAERGQRAAFRLLKDCRPRPFVCGIVHTPIAHEPEFERAYGVRHLLRLPFEARDIDAVVAGALDHLRQRSAFVIDPLAETRTALVEALGRCLFRFDVHAYDDIAGALDDLDLFRSDLVMINVDTLPGRNFAQLPMIRKMAAGAPVIGLSEDRDPKLRLNLRAAGTSGFLMRPFLVQDLDVLFSELAGLGRPANDVAA